MTLEWVDTHAHLDDAAFDRDRETVVAEAAAVGVGTIVNIGYRPAAWWSTLALAERHAAVRFTLGIHPAHADEFSAANLDELARLVEATRPVAVGEIGLDFFRNGAPREMQEEAFRQQLRLAAAVGLPAVIHQRAAEPELVAVCESEPDLPQLILHSFEGSVRYATFASDHRCVIGVSGLATRPAAAPLRAVLATVDPARVVLETDSPFLVPAGLRDRRNTPANVPRIGAAVAHLWGYGPDDLARQTSQTAANVFRLGTVARLSCTDVL